MSTPRPDGRTTRWAGHRDQRRRAFVDAALVVIDRIGPAATVDQIAAEIGVTRQTVYRQFADRRDLDHAISDRAAELLVADVLPHLDGGLGSGGLELGAGGLEPTIRRVLYAYLDHVQGNLPLYRFVRAHEAEVAADSAVRRVKETVAGSIAALARQVLVDLDLPERMAATFATGIIGMADAVIGGWLDAPEGLSRDELVDQLTLMLTGMLAGAVLGASSRP